MDDDDDGRLGTDADVLAHRERMLRRIGVERRLAAMYAADVDYHDVVALMCRTGWTVDQAFELLRP